MSRVDVAPTLSIITPSAQVPASLLDHDRASSLVSFGSQMPIFFPSFHHIFDGIYRYPSFLSPPFLEFPLRNFLLLIFSDMNWRLTEASLVSILSCSQTGREHLMVPSPHWQV